MLDYECILGAGKARRFDWLCDNYDNLEASERREFNDICDILRDAEDEECRRSYYNQGMAECYGPDTVFDGAW